MELDYAVIGKRISQRRKKLGLKQSEVEEKADIGYKYLSNIERGITIPSTEVIIRLASALGTTPDEFLIGVVHESEAERKSVERLLRNLNEKQLSLAKSFLLWLSEQEL